MGNFLDNVSKAVQKGISPQDALFAANYLAKFYINPAAVVVPSLSYIFEIVKNFQDNIGIEVDGVIGEQTLRAMEYPRCGISDALSIILELSQWKNKKKLLYKFESYLSLLSKSKQEEMFFNAVNSWQTVCGISFDITRTGYPDIIINASALRREEFGRSGGVLAWCELPQGDDRQLNLKVDDSEIWTDDYSKPGIYYEAVVCHEMGHGIGLGHLQQPKQLMNPFYNPLLSKPQQFDIKEAFDRYGSSVTISPVIPKEYTMIVKGEINFDGYKLVPN